MVHPFLVDQRPYLPRVASSASSASHRTSASSSASTSSHSASPYFTPGSAIPAAAASCAASIAASSRSHKRSDSISSTETCSSPQIDAACLRFMSEASGSQHLFGSVSSRGSSISAEERRLRREVIPPAGVIAKQSKRLGKFF